jgi:redox-sensing transcriptional repressor
MDQANKNKKISPITIERLSLYLRCLVRMQEEGHDTVSSRKLAELLIVNPAQIRKDFSYFGGFGQKGKGYVIQDLIRGISAILGVDKQWQVAVVGVGNLGSAILKDRGFLVRGFDLVAAFDVDPQKINSVINNRRVYAMEEMAAVVKSQNISMMMITTPPDFAQVTANLIIESGVNAILNFTHRHIETPQEVMVRDVDFIREMEILTFHLTQGSQKTAELPPRNESL